MASNWLWREKRDGTRGPGYLVYLAAGAAALVAIGVIHRRMEAPPPRHRASGRSRGANVATITGAAAHMAPVPDQASPSPAATRSFRLETKPKRRKSAKTAAADDTFDPIEAALAPDPTSANVGDGDGFAALASALAPEPAAGSPDATGSKAQRPLLFGYRDPSADPGAAEAGNGAAPEHRMLPRATLIPVFLLTTVDTGDPAAVLQFGVADDVVRRQRVALPFGTRLLGHLSGQPNRDRLDLVADTVLFPDGRQVAIKAGAVEAADDGSDIHPGVAAAYFPPPTWVELAPYFSDFFTGYMGILQSRAQQQLSVGVGPVNVQSSAPDEARAPAYQASSQAIQDFVQGRLKEMEKRYAAYHLIPAGTPFWLQLLDDLDLTPARASSHADASPHSAP